MPFIAIQQHAPIINGFVPVLISFTMSVFSPIAAIAITIKNLLNILNGAKKSAGTEHETAIVVIIEAITK